MSGIVDMNVHLASAPDQSADLEVADHDPVQRVRLLSEQARSLGIEHLNLVSLDTSLVQRAPETIRAARELGHSATVMLDPRSKSVRADIELAGRLGARGVKLHPYLQQLDADSETQVVEVARGCQQAGLWLALCCSYGTSDVHRISGPRLLAAVVRAGVSGIPLLALHAGGAAVLDVMSIAMDAPNVYLELSFSPSWWRGSSVEQDIAFAVRRLGAERCVHGSDHPYVDMEVAVDVTRQFLARHDFTPDEVAMILGGTARRHLL